jgi:hypothetical protein
MALRNATLPALTQVTGCFTLGFKNNKVTLAPFLDIERAFNKVWITDLISKLTKVDVPPQFTNIIVYITSAKIVFRVVHENSESTRRPIQPGLPQGSLLESVLINVFTKSLTIRRKRQPCSHLNMW